MYFLHRRLYTVAQRMANEHIILLSMKYKSTIK